MPTRDYTELRIFGDGSVALPRGPGVRRRTLDASPRHRRVVLRLSPVPPASRIPEMPSPRLPLPWLERVNRQALATRLITATVHDVANALQVVSGAAEVLAMDPSPSAVEKRTGSIVGQAMHATVVLKALTGFVKDAAAPPQPVDLRELADRVLALRQYTLRKLRIDARADGPEAMGLACERRLLQAILNVCLNAEQAAAGVEAPTMRFVTTVDDDTASLHVIDNGAGVAPELEARLFDWPEVLPADGDALGIGLAVSRALLALDGGTLDHRNGPHGGAVFTVTVPRRSRQA